MKRIFSKRSGFTLVEIIVAFAVFAIMATMILSMVQLTVRQRNVNNQMANNLINDNEYLAAHYVGDADKFDTNEAAAGSFKLDFGETTDVEAAMDYQMRGNPEYTNEAGGINYFVGDTKYTGVEEIEADSENDPIEGFGNQQDSRYETWISGTRGLEYVKIWDVVKDTTYTGTGVRYFIKCSASSSGVDDEYIPYTQYRISFKMPTYKTITRKEDDGKTYEYKIKYNAEILDYGYNNNTDNSLVWNDATCVSHTDHIPRSGFPRNQYLVEKSSPHTIHITSPFGSGGGYEMTAANYTMFWVVFKEDPQLTVNSFGSNGVVDGSGIKYTNYPIYEDDGSESGEYNLNIYGARELEKTLVSDS